MRIVSADDSLICGNNDPRRRIVELWQFVDLDEAHPFAGVGRAVIRHAAIAGLSDRHHARRVITDMSVGVGIDDVLRGRSEYFEPGGKLFPVSGAVDEVNGVGRVQRWIECSPAERVTLARSEEHTS